VHEDFFRSVVRTDEAIALDRIEELDTTRDARHFPSTSALVDADRYRRVVRILVDLPVPPRRRLEDSETLSDLAPLPERVAGPFLRFWYSKRISTLAIDATALWLRKRDLHLMSRAKA
jgi:hypothetical protein